VLTELGIEEKDTLLVLNKIDAIRNPADLNRVLDRYPNAIPVSARGKKGLSALVEVVGEALGREFLDIEVDLDPSNGKLLAYLSAKGEVLSREYGDELITVHVRMPVVAMGEVHRQAIAIRPAGDEQQEFIPATITDSDLPTSDASSEVA
jgi:GTP-binding protein HflX